MTREWLIAELERAWQMRMRIENALMDAYGLNTKFENHVVWRNWRKLINSLQQLHKERGYAAKEAPIDNRT